MGKDFASREQMISTLRSTAIQDTDQIAKKSMRFALFSSLPPLAIGDTSFDMKHIPKRDANGKVITAPRNFVTASLKSGKVQSSYFSPLGFVTIGDKYCDPDRQTRLYELEKKRKIPADKPLFKPASDTTNKTIVKAPFVHQTELGKEKKKKIRDEQGKVITQPFNIVTGPTNIINNNYQHAKDEYDRVRELQKQQTKHHKELMKERPPFRTWDVGQKEFSKIKDTYGLNQPLPKPSTKKPIKYNIKEHEQPFKPSNPGKMGYNRTINKFPEYKPDPIRQTIRKHKSESKEQPYKPIHSGNLTRPTPTISCHPLNLRKEMK